ILMNASRARNDIKTARRLWVCSASRSGGEARALRDAASACSRARANIVCSRWVRSQTFSLVESSAPPGPPAGAAGEAGGGTPGAAEVGITSTGGASGGAPDVGRWPGRRRRDRPGLLMIITTSAGRDRPPAHGRRRLGTARGTVTGCDEENGGH